jgi:hypothetical protein
MLKRFKVLIVVLTMMFLYTNNSLTYAVSQADDQPIDTEAFIKQLKELQKKVS